MDLLHPRREEFPCSPGELRAQRTLQAAGKLMRQPGQVPPASAEQELLDYMREIKRKSYGHAGSLLSALSAAS